MVGVFAQLFKIIFGDLGIYIKSAAQKHMRLECSRPLLDLRSADKDVSLGLIVTMHDIGVHRYEPESKQDDMQLNKNDIASPTKFKVTYSAEKLMAMIFWNSENILLINYKDKEVSVNKEGNRGDVQPPESKVNRSKHRNQFLVSAFYEDRIDTVSNCVY